MICIFSLFDVELIYVYQIISWIYIFFLQKSADFVMILDDYIRNLLGGILNGQKIRLSVCRRQCKNAWTSRRQGRKPRRNDQYRSSCSLRFYDYDRSLHAVLWGRQTNQRRYQSGNYGKHHQTRRKSGYEIRWQRESASRFRSLGRKSVHARYDGHDPQPRS